MCENFRNGHICIATQDLEHLRFVKWSIPNELKNNTVVNHHMRELEPFDEFIGIIWRIKNLKTNILPGKFSDIDKTAVENKISKYKARGMKIVEEINKDLFPYHWEYILGRNGELKLYLTKGRNSMLDYLINE